jgi:hypothetical protein
MDCECRDDHVLPVSFIKTGTDAFLD